MSNARRDNRTSATLSNKARRCRNCGAPDNLRCARAENLRYHSCGKMGHFASVCESAAPIHSTTCNEPFSTALPENPGFGEEDVWCLTVNSFGSPQAYPLYSLVINGRYAKVKIDSGSKPNIMGEKQFKQLGGTSDMLHKPSVKLYPYMHTVLLPVIGVARFLLQDRGSAFNVDFYVAKGSGPILLGSASAVAAGLLRIGPEPRKTEVA